MNRVGILGWMLVVLIACFGYCNAASEGGKINEKADYVAMFNEFSRPDNYDPKLNAADNYKRAFALAAKRPDGLSVADMKAWPTDLAEDKQKKLDKWVADNASALRQLEIGTRKAYYWQQLEGEHLWPIKIPEIGDGAFLSWALCRRAKSNATKGDFKKAFSDLLVCYRLGLHYGGKKTLVEQLVGTAMRVNSVESAMQILSRTDPDVHYLKDFQNRIQNLSSQNKVHIDFTFERLSEHDQIQRIFTDDGMGSGRPNKESYDQIIEEADFPAVMKEMYGIGEEEFRNEWEILDRRQTAGLVDKMYDHLEKLSRMSPWQLRDGAFRTLKEIIESNAFLKWGKLGYEMVLETSWRATVSTDALITTLALKRFKAEKGKYPDSLDELIAKGYLKSVPQDPFGDGALVYKRVSDDFILYCRGADLDDDGGVYSRWGEGEDGGDQVFWPVREKFAQKLEMGE